MDFKRTVIANLILSACVGGSAWAASLPGINDGHQLWEGDKVATGSWHGIDISSERQVTIEANGNIHSYGNHGGMFIANKASVTFQNTGLDKRFLITGNAWDGIIVESGANLTIDGMDVISNFNGSADENDGNGLRANKGGQVIVKNATLAEFNGNKAVGIFALSDERLSEVHLSGKAGGDAGLQVNNNGMEGIRAEKNAFITITDMDVEVNKNKEYGVRAHDGGVINLIGDGINTLDVAANNSSDKNKGDGILAEHVDKTGASSMVTIKDMNVSVNDQAYQGIAARHGGLVKIISDSANNLLEVYNTRMADILGNGDDAGKGIHARDSDSETGQRAGISLENMNVISNGNEREGLVAALSGIIYVGSTDGENTLIANQNKQYDTATPDKWAYGAGILAHGVSEYSKDKQAAIIIENMNIEASGNGLYGLYARDGGIISITGDGRQSLAITGNKSTVAGTGDAGIAVDGLHENGTSDDPAKVFIKNMAVAINDNGRYGIDVTRGGQMDIRSTTRNTLTISGNQTGNADNNEGIGINVAGVFGDTQSRLDIADMDVTIAGSPDAGIKVSDGALVNIVSSQGNNTLTANGSDNNGSNGRYNAGTGLFAFDSNRELDSAALLNIAGMNIEANNNGSYGVLAEGAKVQIAGNGSHRLNVEDNRRYGLLAKDGGSIDLAGMKVSGNSLGHSLVGIEREGSISLANSVITTDTDALFYTWSDSDTQTSQINLKESVAIGNGTKLAWFTAHNSELKASHAWLENAIGTDTKEGITSTVALDNSTWLMRDSSNITHLSLNHSITDMRQKGGYNTLTVGSLASDNSTYLLNTWFDTAGLTSDKIIVDGGAGTGNDNVLRVYSTGYAEDTREVNGYGIQVVNLDNATDKSVDFRLYGGVVDSGAYDYYLYRAVDDNYYLQTDYQPTTTAKAITNIPAIHLSIVKSGLNEFRHRITELREQDIFQPNEVWVRSWGKHLKIDDTIDSKMNLYGIELGYDKEIHENEDNKYYAGVMAGYMYADNIRHHNAGYPDGSAKANTPGVGLYGVWDNSEGWYSTGTLRYFWSKMKARNYTSAGEKITFNPDRNYFAATVELGKQFEDVIDEKSKWIIEPKAELGYAYADSKSFKTNMNTRVHYGSSDSFTTRVALLLGYNSEAESGSIYEPFVEVGVNREWLGKTDVTYAGARFNSDQQGTGFDLAVGLRARTSENWSFTGNLGYEKSEVIQGVGAQLGVRYSW